MHVAASLKVFEVEILVRELSVLVDLAVGVPSRMTRPTEQGHRTIVPVFAVPFLPQSHLLSNLLVYAEYW